MRSRFSNPRAWVGGVGIRAEGASPVPYPTSAWSMSCCSRLFDETICNMVPSPNHMRYRYWESLRSQPLYPPAVPLAAIDEAIVHPAIPALPELDHVRAQQVTAPVSGARHVHIAQLSRHLLVSSVEFVPLDRAALRRDGGGNLAVGGPAREVGVRLLDREPLNLTP